MLALIIIGTPLLLFALLFVYFYLTQPPLIVGRSHRRPGYIPLSRRVSGSASPIMAPIRTHTATSTGCRTDGPWPVGVDVPVTRPAKNRTTAPIDSGSVTATPPGDLMTAAIGPSFGYVEPPTPQEMSRLVALGYFGSATGIGKASG